MEWNLAQINVAHCRAPLDSPVMKGFVDLLDSINALAEASPGFKWRLKSSAGNATDIKAYDDPRIIVNMSVWESVETLRDYVYRSGHVDAFRRRKDWFDDSLDPRLALWWVPAGATPTAEEGKRRLECLARLGSTNEAFTFKSICPPPV